MTRDNQGAPTSAGLRFIPRTSAPLPPDRQARLEQLLVERRLVTPDDLLIARDHAARERLPLADAIIDEGLAPEWSVYEALAAVSDMDLVHLSDVIPGTLAVRLVPERVARRYGVVPLSENNRVLTFATFRPFDPELERDVAFASGRTPKALLAAKAEVLEALDRIYPRLNDIDRLLERVRCDSPIDAIDVGEGGADTESPVIDLCNHLIARAVEGEASDIHFEPGPAGLSVRYRIGGILESSITIPPHSAPFIVNRFKIMARTDISVRHRPQDGGFRLLINGRPIDVRLSTLPTINGEKLVMRVIDAAVSPQTLEFLGYDQANLVRLRQALDRPDGLVLITGPTGSGKTTVLYSALHYLRNGHRNIVTVEDPVERRIAGVNQIAVNSRSGNTFTEVLRSVLRQDPNVLMVGEIRDAEVAQIVGQAAYTGQLVLTTLHTSDSASAITRMLNLGLEPFRIAESLSAIVAQRLVRRLCPHCKHEYDAEEAVRLGQEHGIPRVAAGAGRGCEACRQTGYLDRIPVAEVLVPDAAMRDAIGRGATATEIRQFMQAAGAMSMRQRGLQLVAEGATSLEEIDRVLSPEAAPAQSTHGQRVLVVDDDRITRMLVTLLLEKEGFSLIEGTNGLQGVELARRERPDLVIIDLMMPEMDGYEAIRRIRADVALASIPVIVLTAEDGPGIEHRVLELGADDYIVKPPEPAVLLARVRAAFRRLDRAVA